MFNGLLPAQNPFVTGAIFIATYLTALALGRVLKRRAGIRFGVLYQLFCLSARLLCGADGARPADAPGADMSARS